MEGRKHEMAGLGQRQGGSDGLQVAHFPDEDRVGVLTRQPSRRAQMNRCRSQFALVDGRTDVRMQEFDRVLDGHDVAILVLVYQIDHRREGRGLAGAVARLPGPARAAMINLINQNKDGHIMTIEDPIEFLHPHIRSTINQRKLGSDTYSFARALKAVLREDATPGTPRPSKLRPALRGTCSCW